MSDTVDSIKYTQILLTPEEKEDLKNLKKEKGYGSWRELVLIESNIRNKEDFK